MTDDLDPIDDLISLDDGWILDVISQGSPKAKSQKRRFKPSIVLTSDAENDQASEGELEIPAIFLTQGAKNSRLLRQSKEIAKQLTEDELRRKANEEELKELETKLMAELNDNGLVHLYQSTQEIESYVHRYYAKDQTLNAQRHYYYLNEVFKVDMAVDLPYLRLLFGNIFEFTSRNHPHLVVSLAENGIDISTFVGYALANVDSIRHLEAVEAFTRYATSEVDDASSSSLGSLSHVLTKVGAREDVSLKLVHYNNYPKLLILRLSMVFHLFIHFSMSTEFFLEMLQQFILASSDFLLNKREKTYLLERFVKPVFQRMIQKRLLSLPASAPDDARDVVVIEISQVLASINTCTYGEAAGEWRSKDYELRYNFLHNLHFAFPHKHTQINEVIELLSMAFIDCETPSVQTLTTVINRIGKTDIEEKTQANKVFHNVYKARIVSIFLMDLLYGSSLQQLQAQKKEFLILRKGLETCKDHLQHAIGRILYMRAENVGCKMEISTALSKTYHVLDHLNTALDRNMVFIRNDIFYEDGHGA